MIDWKEGKPNTPIDCCLVMYMEDYEFAQWNGERWRVFHGDEGGNKLFEAMEPIEFYARLNKP